MFVYTPLQLYLVDALTYAASALAAASVLRSLFGFAFPLVGSRWQPWALEEETPC